MPVAVGDETIKLATKMLNRMAGKQYMRSSTTQMSNSLVEGVEVDPYLCEFIRKEVHNKIQEIQSTGFQIMKLDYELEIRKLTDEVFSIGVIPVFQLQGQTVSREFNLSADQILKLAAYEETRSPSLPKPVLFTPASSSQEPNIAVNDLLKTGKVEVYPSRPGKTYLVFDKKHDINEVARLINLQYGEGACRITKQNNTIEVIHAAVLKTKAELDQASKKTVTLPDIAVNGKLETYAQRPGKQYMVFENDADRLEADRVIKQQFGAHASRLSAQPNTIEITDQDALDAIRVIKASFSAEVTQLPRKLSH